MPNLADELYELYIAGVNPVLARNDPMYQKSLVKVGLGWTATGAVSPARSVAFQQEMKLHAWLAARKIDDARALEPDSIKVHMLEGPVTLYRGTETGSQAPPSIWWFNEKVAQRCRDEAGADPRKRLEWLRNVLAVCYNWNAFDCLQRLALHRGESIPAVFGKGLPMPHYKIAVQRGGKVELPIDYWKRKGDVLLGGELQVVLPWIPVWRVDETSVL